MDPNEAKAILIEAKDTDWYSSENLRSLLTDPTKFSWWGKCGLEIDKNALSKFDTEAILNELESKPNAHDLKQNKTLDIIVCLFSCLLSCLASSLNDAFYWPIILVSAFLYFSDRFKLIWSFVAIYIWLIIVGAYGMENGGSISFFFVVLPLLSIVVRNWFSLLAKPKYSFETFSFRDYWVSLIDSRIERLNTEGLNIFTKIKRSKSSIRGFIDIIECHIIGKKQQEYIPVFSPAFGCATIISFIGIMSLEGEGIETYKLWFYLVLAIMNILIFYFHYRNLGLNSNTRFRMAVYVCIIGSFLGVFIAWAGLVLILAALMLVAGGINGVRDWKAERGIRQWSIDYFNKSNDPLKWL